MSAAIAGRLSYLDGDTPDPKNWRYVDRLPQCPYNEAT
jgi:hypothetical protein